MWLIRVVDKVLVHFLYEKCPRYAILSHRWGEADSEVSFQDMWNYEMATSFRNFDKIWRVCDQAAMDDFEYVWIDTCCINKDSSAELSEAINSMYRWYQGATVCYAYLADVQCGPREDDLTIGIATSEWFERGWTLQELVAPAKVVFFNNDWVQLGTKSSLTSVLHDRTGIDPAILNGHESPLDRSVAQRMSWASQRKTTRVEDMSYCLLGIFDVNMPMLYGEGEKAFLRLQEEIIKVSEDQSLFAWPLATIQESKNLATNDSSFADMRRPMYGMLADSPAAFEQCQYMSTTQVSRNRTAYAMTNRGLSIELDARLFAIDTYLVRLYCDDSSIPPEGGVASRGPYNLGLFVTRLYEDDQFARVAVHQGVSRMRIDCADWDWDARPLVEAAGRLKMNVPRRIGRPFDTNSSSYDPQRILVYEQGLRFGNSTSAQLEHGQINYWGAWINNKPIIKFDSQKFYTDGLFGRGDIVLRPSLRHSGGLQYLVVTFDFHSNPICFMLIDKAKEDSAESPVTADFEWHLLSRKLGNSLSWSRWIGNGRCVVESRSHPGLWAIKGNHSSGIDVDLISIDPTEQAMHLRMEKRVIEQGDERGMLVWDIDFYSKPSTQFHKWAVEEMILRDSSKS